MPKVHDSSSCHSQILWIPLSNLAHYHSTLQSNELKMRSYLMFQEEHAKRVPGHNQQDFQRPSIFCQYHQAYLGGFNQRSTSSVHNKIEAAPLVLQLVTVQEWLSRNPSMGQHGFSETLLSEFHPSMLLLHSSDSVLQRPTTEILIS